MALAYNVQPINLIPDFIPVVGLADNVIITAWAVRSALRRSGAGVVLGHWRGGPASFTLLCRLCHLHMPPELSAGDDLEPSKKCDRLDRRERDVTGLR